MELACASPARVGITHVALPSPGVPLVYIAAGQNEVGLWDVLDGNCHQVSHQWVQLGDVGA